MKFVSPMGQLRPFFVDKNGKRLAGGEVYTYEAGTLTPKNTFRDGAGTIPNTNPIILDGSGEADIYLSGFYRFRVLDRQGNLIFDVDDFKALDEINLAVFDDAVQQTQELRNNAAELVSEAEALLSNTTEQANAAEDAATNATTQVNGLKGYVDSALTGLSFANKTYATVAAANADIANIAVNQSVWVSSEAEGGLYEKKTADATSLTKSAYDPVERAKDYADQNKLELDQKIQRTSDLVQKNNATYTHFFIDKNDYIVAALKEDGDLVLAGLEESVQHEIGTLKETTQLDTSDVSHTILDKDQNVIAYFNKESKLYLTGLAESVQDTLLNQKVKTDSKKSIHDFYTIEAMNFVNNRIANNLETAPIPYPLLPQPFEVGQTWQNNLTMPVSTDQIHIAGFNGNRWSESIGVCHPYLIRFDTPFHGYKYWCCITPYTSSVEDYEIPWMYGSNDDDLKEWHLIGGGVPMPIDVDPSTTGTEYISGHLSDNGMTYNPITGELVVYWRKSMRRTSSDIDDQLLYRTTKNGREWSEIKQLHPIRTRLQNSMFSPSIIFDPKTGLFHLYTVGMYKADGNYHAIQHQTSYDLENWSEVEYLTAYNNLRPWHLEVKWVGDAQVMLLHLESNANADKLIVGVAKNFTDFEFNQNLFTEGVDIYKSTFLPIFEGNQIALKVFYTTDEFTTPNWQGHITQTNFTNYGV